MAGRSGRGKADLTDAERAWPVRRCCLAVETARRPRVRTERQLIDGIRWRPLGWLPWRDMPPQYVNGGGEVHAFPALADQGDISDSPHAPSGSREYQWPVHSRPDSRAA